MELAVGDRQEREERIEAAAIQTAERLAELVEFTAALAAFATEGARRQEQDSVTARRRHRQVLVAAWAAVFASIATVAVTLGF